MRHNLRFDQHGVLAAVAADRSPRAKNQQVSVMSQPKLHDLEPSQVRSPPMPLSRPGLRASDLTAAAVPPGPRVKGRRRLAGPDWSSGPLHPPTATRFLDPATGAG
jgi:hypothetical protein